MSLIFVNLSKIRRLYFREPLLLHISNFVKVKNILKYENKIAKENFMSTSYKCD